jgi:hypothetical protein
MVAVAVVIVAAAAVEMAVAPAAPLHGLPARAGAAPPGRRSTTPRKAPSTCGRTHPGHQSCLGCRTPSLLHHRWGHHSCLLWGLCLFLKLYHLSRSPRHCGQGVGSTVPHRLLQHHEAHSPSPVTKWVANSGASNHTTLYSGSISSPHPPLAFHPCSIIVGNGSILPITSLGDSVLPGPFYLNDVLVALDLL